jgi:undecaprenyl-diphosphatase
VIGVAQAFAILPGISRSGSTIVTGIFVGISREEAAKFSFLLSLPAILGASVLKINDLLSLGNSTISLTYLLVGAVVAFISGYLAILWLLNVVKKGKLEWFAYYCYFIVILAYIWYVLNQ